MDILQAIVLGILQGATEFIPISSSGHLVLVPWLLRWPEPGLLFDTMVHWGTLLAVVAYFWRDWWLLITAGLRGLLRRDWSDPRSRLLWLLVLGSIPAAILGLLLEDFFESLFSEPAWVAFFLSMGLINLYVAFNFETGTWVNFKLFGFTALMFAFIIAQSLMLSKYLKEPE